MCIRDRTVALAGFGNVAWGAAKKLAELGAKAVTLSGPDGYIYDPDGVVTEEKINYMLEMRASGRKMCIRDRHEQRYQRLFLMTTGLKNEIYFMRKNSEEIESVMANRCV